MNQVYCNPSCRGRAARWAEKQKRLVFKPSDATVDERILWVEEMPDLNRVRELAAMLEHVVRTTRTPRAVIIHGTFPAGWENTEAVDVMRDGNAAKPTWNMFCAPENMGIAAVKKSRLWEAMREVPEARNTLLEAVATRTEPQGDGLDVPLTAPGPPPPSLHDL